MQFHRMDLACYMQSAHRQYGERAPLADGGLICSRVVGRSLDRDAWGWCCGSKELTRSLSSPNFAGLVAKAEKNAL